MLWTGPSPAVSGSFRALLLELAQQRSLEVLLPLITRRVAEHEDVALARLWLLEPGDRCTGCNNVRVCTDRTRCLHLVASAGRSRSGAVTVHRPDQGAFQRIPVGAFKVGLVAARAAPVVVTDPAHDAKIRRPEWVSAEGIAGFAGLPLTCRGQLLGVLGVFVRAPITDAAVDVLHILANHAAAAIATARAFAGAEVLRHQLAMENQLLRRNVESGLGGGLPDGLADGFGDALAGLVGKSPALLGVLRDIDAVAPTDATVLVQGESGTGKELVARALHLRSPRRGGPLVEVNCAAIPRELSESELFGHVKGAFSGAVRDRMGRFEAAGGGTLFLDELGELPLELQGKLLRVLQEGTYERVGEGKTRHADVRLIAATNRDLAVEVQRGRFREDLYYRLAVYPIHVPPLRARKEDLPQLAVHLLDRICRRLRRPAPALSPAQLAELARHDWPGNVRELRNVLERGVISAADGQVRLSLGEQQQSLGGRSNVALPMLSAPASASVPALEGPVHPVHSTIFASINVGPSPILSDAEMRRRERDNLLAALERCHGKIYGEGGAAALLGLKPTTLASRLKQMGIHRSAI